MADNGHLDNAATLGRGQIELELPLSVAMGGPVKGLPQAFVVRKAHVSNQVCGHGDKMVGV